jgi:hypothetical protein
MTAVIKDSVRVCAKTVTYTTKKKLITSKKKLKKE